jgi:hypothetical protein
MNPSATCMKPYLINSGRRSKLARSDALVMMKCETTSDCSDLRYSPV